MSARVPCHTSSACCRAMSALLPKGRLVTLFDLTLRGDLNGETGTVLFFNASRGRYAVKVRARRGV